MAKKQVSLSHRTTPTWGRTLFSGFLYCGACGSRLSSTHIVKHYQRKDGLITTTRTQKYICQQRRNGIPCKCPGQHTYLAEILEKKVIAELTAFLEKKWKREPHVIAEAQFLDRKYELEESLEAFQEIENRSWSGECRSCDRKLLLLWKENPSFQWNRFSKCIHSAKRN